MKNKIFLYALLFLILAGGIGFSYYTFNKQIPVTEIKDSVFSGYLDNKTETFTESTDWYDVKIIYPKNNQKVRDEIFSLWNNFSKENLLTTFSDAKTAREELGLNVDGLKYSFSAEYKLVNSEDTISYIYEIYSFTGGAHGSTVIYPITFNTKLEHLSPEQILPDDKLQKISEISFTEIQKQKADRLKGTGMSKVEIQEMLKDTTWVKEGTDPKRDNYNSIWYDGEDLVISFGQYQVGSYAEGIYEVKIPRNSI